VLVPVFLWWETRARHPLVLSLYRQQNFGTDSIVLAGVQFALVGASVFGAVWSQQVLGFSAIRAGVALLPLTIPLLFVAPVAAGCTTGRPPAAAGRRLAADRARPGVARLAPAPARVRLADPGLHRHGIGIGLTISPATTDALGAATAGERSQASGIVQTVRQIGGVIGIAVLGAIVANVSAVAPAPSAAEHVTAATNGVAMAFWTAAGMAVVRPSSPPRSCGGGLPTESRSAGAKTA